MADIIDFPGSYYGDLDSSEMLNNIAEQKPSKCFVIVWPADGSMPTYHSNTLDVPVVVYRINEFLHKLYNGDYKHE